MNKSKELCESCGSPIGKRKFSLVNSKKQLREFCSAACRGAGRASGKKTRRNKIDE